MQGLVPDYIHRLWNLKKRSVMIKKKERYLPFKKNVIYVK
ncbi:hypothetical protein BAOM_1027 [Peribacillus asahii]|uniref:Transposase n=1 Tax=Peribacillus asahii TaxID=228899 RepID=A0A3Q9RKV3_9BACI|nr:hypothetical protein BAOM_1027 [Peribacillus asahii]